MGYENAGSFYPVRIRLSLRVDADKNSNSILTRSWKHFY